jgi:hypothetical protein
VYRLHVEESLQVKSSRPRVDEQWLKAGNIFVGRVLRKRKDTKRAAVRNVKNGWAERCGDGIWETGLMGREGPKSTFLCWFSL